MYHTEYNLLSWQGDCQSAMVSKCKNFVCKCKNVKCKKNPKKDASMVVLEQRIENNAPSVVGENYPIMGL